MIKSSVAALGIALSLALSSTGAFAGGSVDVATFGINDDTSVQQFGQNTASVETHGHDVLTDVMQLGTGGNVGVLTVGHDIRTHVFTGICPPGSRGHKVVLTNPNSLNVLIVPCGRS